MPAHVVPVGACQLPLLADLASACGYSPPAAAHTAPCPCRPCPTPSRRPQWDYAALCFALGVLSTAAGQLLVLWVSRHLRSRSLLVFLMAAVLGISCVALGIQGAQATAAAARSGSLWAFHDVCGRAAV